MHPSALLTSGVVTSSQVREVFEDLVASGRTPSLAIWNTLLAGLAAQGAWADALSALQQVQPASCGWHSQAVLHTKCWTLGRA